jgi:photosystem II stability/assembly factor-like uncharacterized protein
MNVSTYRRLLAGAFASLILSARVVGAQTTAFTYQGQLASGGSPASGNYDLTFALFNTNSTSTGQQVGATVTNLDVGVTNGLFLATLDFGGVFTGSNYWMSIGVRTNGGAAFTALNPLQKITPTPYAIYAAGAGSVLAVDIVGLIPATQLPPSVVTNGENGVNLTGTFSGNGVGLTNLNGANLAAGSVDTAQLASGTLAAPVVVAGTNIYATANTSFLATNSSATTIVLPTNANIGDVVQIMGAGAGGWVASEYAPVWTQTPAVNSSWYSVASSSDGTHLVAVAIYGGIYTSVNSGATWTVQPGAPGAVQWYSVASSSDGSHLVAVVYGGGIYTSINSGTNWMEQASAPISTSWQLVASSSDGTHLVAVVYGGGIYTSINSGTNWTEQAGAPNTFNWTSVASSSDGTHLAAVVGNGGIYTSVNSGTNWTEQTAAPTSAYWQSVASSFDGTHLVAAVYPGGIYTSINSGTNWTEQTSAPTNAAWWCLASSSNGTHLVAVVYPGGIYSSTNSGTNWTEQTSAPIGVYWGSVASSSDGTHLVAVVDYAGIYVNLGIVPVSMGAQGSIGSMQYLGNGQWAPEALSQASLPASVVTNTETGVTLTGTFSGNGAGLTALNASQLTSGTVTDARLSANVALLNANQTFSGTNIFANNVGIGTTTPAYALHTVSPSGDCQIAVQSGDAGNHLWTIQSSGNENGGVYIGQFQIIDRTLDLARLTIATNGNVGLGTTSPNYALQVNGSVAGVGAYNNVSDARFKTNITRLTHALEKVMALQGVEYDWRSNAYPQMKFDQGKQLGFVAQEIKEVLPEVVSQDSNGYYSIAYSKVIPVLVEAIKDQQQEAMEKNAEIEKLKAKSDKVDVLEKQLGELKQMVQALAEKKMSGQ